MKIKELLVPALQGKIPYDKEIQKAVSNGSLQYKTATITYLVSENGFYTYTNKQRLVSINRIYHSSNVYMQQKHGYVNIEDDCDDGDDHDGDAHDGDAHDATTTQKLVYINMFTETETPTNIIPYHHSRIQFTRHVLKQDKNANVELICEVFENLPCKVQFQIKDGFDIHSSVIQQELNVLCSYLV